MLATLHRSHSFRHLSTCQSLDFVSVKFSFLNIKMAKLVSQAPVLVKQLITQAEPKFQVFLKYAKVELTPPSVGDIPQIRAGLGKLLNGAKTGKWKQTTVREAWLNTLVTIEVLCWFYVGECIGKRHLVGYKV